VAGNLSPKLEWNLANPKWAATLNPLLANPMNNMSILKNVQLKTGTNVINHLLGRTMQGWIQIDIQGNAQIYRNADFNNATLSLWSTAPVTVSLGVF
jgi:hypothetical protein